jgi:hypothetical protein
LCVDAVVGFLLATLVLSAVVGTRGPTAPAPATVTPVLGEPMPDVQPLLDHPLSPDGGPVPFHYQEVRP